jgi:hypothetical protein
MAEGSTKETAKKQKATDVRGFMIRDRALLRSTQGANP